MSRIQIADLNSSEFGFLYDVNDAEMLAIVGGRLFSKFSKLRSYILELNKLQKKGGGCTEEGGGIISPKHKKLEI